MPRGSVETVLSETTKARIEELEAELMEKEDTNYDLESQIEELNNKIEALTSENEILAQRAEEQKGGKKSDAFGFSDDSDGSKGQAQESIEDLRR